MKIKINILILEHDQNDLGLLLYELKKSGLSFNTWVVQAKPEYENALYHYKPDIILSDYSLPSFDGLNAFKIKQAICPETPFIMVSGTLGEENAVELIRMGVTDYVLKDKIFQIGPKINRALKEAEDRLHKETALQQLQQREEHLQKIMDLSLDLICTLDQDGRIVMISAAAKLLLDYKPEELIGKSLLSLVHKEDEKKVYRAITNLKNGIDVINLEYRLLRKSGAPIYLLWSARWDENDQLGYGIAKDITEIKKAEAKIISNEKRFRTLLQNSADGIVLLAPDGTVLERSPTAIKILGLNEQELSGKLRVDLVHPDDLPVVQQAFSQVLIYPDEILTAECRLCRPEGHYIWIEATLHNLLSEPAVNAIVLNFRDITERKLAEITIEKSEEKYRNLFNLSPIPMWVYDTGTYQFLDVNQAAIRHYGYSKEEFLAMTLHDIRPKEQQRKLKKELRKVKEKGSFNQTLSSHIKKNGELIHVEVHGTAIVLPGKKARVVVATDISERIIYIQAIEEQNKVLREIAWTQSHVVRAPLARIMGLVNLLQNYQSVQQNTTEIMSFIQESANELDDIIKDIVQKTAQLNDQFTQQHQPLL